MTGILRPKFTATGRDGNDVDLEKCLGCAHHEATSVFNLCKHASSQYAVAGKVDFHTIGHMRTVGGCFAQALLHSPIADKRAAA